MSISYLLLFSLICLLCINYTSARTCVCAEFLSFNCNDATHTREGTGAQVPCVWVHRNRSARNGDQGVCRSTLWLRCHNNASCRARPFMYDPVTGKFDLSAVKNPDHVKKDDIKVLDGATSTTSPSHTTKVTIKGVTHPPSEHDDEDWPWDCQAYSYYNETINVAQIDAVTRREEQRILAYNKVNSFAELFSLFSKGTRSSSSASSYFRHFTLDKVTMIIAFAMVVFVIAAFGYYCGQPRKGAFKSLLGDKERIGGYDYTAV